MRILGPIAEPDLAILREADAVFLDEIRRAGVYDEIWQAFAVLLPIRTVGVQGDFRSYDRVIALRAITSEDGMTADLVPLRPRGTRASLFTHRQRSARRQL